MVKGSSVSVSHLIFFEYGELADTQIRVTVSNVRISPEKPIQKMFLVKMNDIMQ